MDKIIKCIECSETFCFSESEQVYFIEKSLSQPKRCKSCRKKNRMSKSGGISKKVTSPKPKDKNSELEIIASKLPQLLTEETITDLGLDEELFHEYSKMSWDVEELIEKFIFSICDLHGTQSKKSVLDLNHKICEKSAQSFRRLLRRYSYLFTKKLISFSSVDSQLIQFQLVKMKQCVIDDSQFNIQEIEKISFVSFSQFLRILESLACISLHHKIKTKKSHKKQSNLPATSYPPIYLNL